MIVTHNKQFSSFGLRLQIGIKRSAAVILSSLGLSDSGHCLHKIHTVQFISYPF